MTSPEGKEARVRKPYKKPRKVTVKETQEGKSEGPKQLAIGGTVDNSTRLDLSEFYIGTETLVDQPIAISSSNEALLKSPGSLKSVSDSSEDEDNRLIVQLMVADKAIEVRQNPYPKGIRLMSEREADEEAKYGKVQRWSSESEGGDVPVALLLKALKDKVETVMPEGEKAIPTIPEGKEAVGSGIARDFGKDMVQRKGHECAGSQTKRYLPCTI